MLNVLHLSTSDMGGGAARAAYRIHQGLQAIGLNSQMLVRTKLSPDATVLAERTLLTKLSPPVSSLPLKLYPKGNRLLFSPQWFPDAIAANVSRLQPDIVNLHWICNGFVQIETLAKLKCPIVWTLHDMWALTGGCHYNESCDRYTEACGACPQLASQQPSDLSRWTWQRKRNAWKNLNLTLVAPSTWMAECARSSALFREVPVRVVPFGLDTTKYKPIDQAFSRQLLNLPSDKQLVLFGAIGATTDYRKGFHLLIPALQQLSQSGWQDQLELVVFGSSRSQTPIDLGFKIHYLGHFNDDITLALAYSAADVMIVPSIQESFGQTASEALACGTPVVAFNATGLKDIVDHQENGYLVQPFEISDLAHGIDWVLEDHDRHQRLKHNARRKAEETFSLVRQAYQYEALYQETLKRAAAPLIVT